jgi:hypothetical protein
MKTLVRLNRAARFGLLSERGKAVLKATGLFLRILGISAAFFAPAVGSAADKAIYYWVSHGSPTDPVWTSFLRVPSNGQKTLAMTFAPRFTAAMSRRNRRQSVPPSPRRREVSSPAHPIRRSTKGNCRCPCGRHSGDHYEHRRQGKWS